MLRWRLKGQFLENENLVRRKILKYFDTDKVKIWGMTVNDFIVIFREKNKF